MSQTPPRSRRLFFALWPEPAQQRTLAQTVAALVPQGAGGRAVPTENLHLTLAFLGAVAEEALPRLRATAAALQSPEGEAAALEVTLDALQYWPRAKLVCAVPMTPVPELAAIAETLKQALIGAGFRPDLKPFRAHVTLTRKVASAPSALTLPPQRWSFEKFSLIESRTAAGGSIYSVVDFWPLYSA